MKVWRDAIAREARTLRAGGAELLRAVYGSPVEADSDADNILFYNVGTGCSERRREEGLRFERRFEVSRQAAEAGMLHAKAGMLGEQTYRVTRVDEGFEAW